MATRLGFPMPFGRRGETEAEGEVRDPRAASAAPDWERRRVRNDDSVVLEIVYREVALLLTGDISAEVEREILPRLTRVRRFASSRSHITAAAHRHQRNCCRNGDRSWRSSAQGAGTPSGIRRRKCFSGSMQLVPPCCAPICMDKSPWRPTAAEIRVKHRFKKSVMDERNHEGHEVASNDLFVV